MLPKRFWLGEILEKLYLISVDTEVRCWDPPMTSIWLETLSPSTAQGWFSLSGRELPGPRPSLHSQGHSSSQQLVNTRVLKSGPFPQWHPSSRVFRGVHGGLWCDGITAQVMEWHSAPYHPFASLRYWSKRIPQYRFCKRSLCLRLYIHLWCFPPIPHEIDTWLIHPLIPWANIRLLINICPTLPRSGRPRPCPCRTWCCDLSRHLHSLPSFSHSQNYPPSLCLHLYLTDCSACLPSSSTSEKPCLSWIM